jgi:hypothetical protein
VKDIQIKIVALLLTAVALTFCYYKVKVLGMPLLPTDSSEVWTVEAKINFRATGGPAKVQFYIPENPPGYVILNEDFISSNYGLATETEGANRKASWAIRRAQGKQALYYRMEIVPGTTPTLASLDNTPPAFPRVPEYEEPMGAAVRAILENARAHSADIMSFTQSLLMILNSPTPDENVALINKPGRDSVEWVREIVNILAGARIPSRIVYVLPLQDRIRHGQLEPWIEVHNEQEWIAFDPRTGKRGYDPEVVVWRVGDSPLVTVQGGKPPTVEFSIARHARAQVAIATDFAAKARSAVVEFSLFALPVQAQNVYRILLTIPLGALVVVVLRNIIGLRTFGTFMPILVALAFRETELMWGIILFTIVVCVGLMIRLYLERLKLLLVPRLASVLTIVIILIAIFSILSVKLNLERGLSIALFPVVIMAMTIERMSIIWEEHGPKDAFLRGSGSLFAASIGYVVMTNEILTHMIFVFPELLLVVLSITLVLGRYSGYRLTELWRFRAMIKEKEAA